MKKILVFVLLFSGLLLAGSCSGTGKNKEVAQNSTEQAINEKVLVKPLSQTEFLQKVSDYASNPDDWKYLGDKPCVIDFYATWCGPCRQMSPIIEELAGELEGKVIFYKVDVDQEPELAGAFGIQSIPTFALCPMEGEPHFMMGAMDKSALKEAIEKYLLK